MFDSIMWIHVISITSDDSNCTEPLIKNTHSVVTLIHITVILHAIFFNVYFKSLQLWLRLLDFQHKTQERSSLNGSARKFCCWLARAWRLV